MNPRTVRKINHSALFFFLFSSILLNACSLTSSELNLAPLFSMHRNAYGGKSWEALGGLITSDSTYKLDEFAIHPIFREAKDPEGVKETDILYPLGYGRNDGIENHWRFLPFYWWKDHQNEKGEHDVDWMFLPFFFGGWSDSGENYFAFFPFFGTIRDFLTFEEVNFILFPLYSRTEKATGRKSVNFLWPIFGYAWGTGHHGLRIFPLYSHDTRDGYYAYYSLLWPFIHFGWTDIDTKYAGSYVAVLPIYSQAEEKGLKTWVIIPPFGYGESKNENSGYRGYDALWPFIKVERGGEQPERTRFLPFFAFYDGKEIHNRTFLWPLIWLRNEHTRHYDRESTYVLPFWHSWERTDKQSKELSSYWQAWPFAHKEWSSNGETDFAFPSPLLFRHMGFRADENFAILWTLYRQRTGKNGESSSRVFANLFRRERGHGEDRVSVPILFGRRGKSDGSSEWSFLAGLIRFRTGTDGFGMMAPSFPGPGWDE